VGKKKGPVDHKMGDFIRLKKQVICLGNKLFRQSVETSSRFGKPLRGFADLFYGFGEMSEQNSKPVSQIRKLVYKTDKPFRQSFKPV